ncbi:MAG TPA: hotdog fold thioesterase [Flavisolibacter sp.]|nr:hotdog fold thioesterase [Flavisolibacter sp.]
MAIWFSSYTLESVQQRGKGTMIEHIGINITEVGDEFLAGTMPVDHRTVQPMGILHGGASVALAETLGSMAASLVIDPSRQYCVGLDINANHMRSARSGYVKGVARPLHLGSSTQVWSIEIKDEQEKLVCISRLTMAVLTKRP